LGPERSEEVYRYVHNLFGVYSAGHETIDIQTMPRLAAARSVSNLKTSSTRMFGIAGLGAFSKLDILDMSMKRLASLPCRYVRMLSAMYATPESLQMFGCIRYLRFDSQIKAVGVWNFASRDSMKRILEGFRHLETPDSYANASYNKNPLSSVRTFPAHQLNIQHYPEVSSEYPQFIGNDWNENVSLAP
jgi:hypothetical protein